MTAVGAVVTLIPATGERMDGTPVRGGVRELFLHHQHNQLFEFCLPENLEQY